MAQFAESREGYMAMARFDANQPRMAQFIQILAHFRRESGAQTYCQWHHIPLGSDQMFKGHLKRDKRRGIVVI
jgi:hypothetical protein